MERGVYMPDIAMLESLSRIFAVTVDEIIAGEDKIAPTVDDTGTEADKTDAKAAILTAFTDKDRIAYFKRKWMHDHIAAIILLYTVILAVLIYGIVMQSHIITAVMPITALVITALWRNAMMAYIESRVWKP